MEIFNSVEGSSGTSPSRATPPMGSSVMSRTSMPCRSATRLWPNSWSSTHAKASRVYTADQTAVAGPSAPARTAAYAGTRRKMRCTRMSMPKRRAILNDHFMGLSMGAGRGRDHACCDFEATWS